MSVQVRGDGMVITGEDQAKILNEVLVKGDLSKLTDEQKVSHLKSVCESLGLNPLTNPFGYFPMNGKLVLYAKKDATDQLRKIHNVSVKIVSRQMVDDMYIVTAEAQFPTGRVDGSTGVVHLAGAKGDIKANLMMKAETKAKRRVTLSICGLGFLDETETEDLPEAKMEPKQIDQNTDKNSEKIESLRQDIGNYAKEEGWDSPKISKIIQTRYFKKNSKELKFSELEDLFKFLQEKKPFEV